MAYGFVPFKAKNMQVLYNKIIIGKVKYPENASEFISDTLKDLL